MNTVPGKFHESCGSRYVHVGFVNSIVVIGLLSMASDVIQAIHQAIDINSKNLRKRMRAAKILALIK
jgi:heme exporter protein D